MDLTRVQHSTPAALPDQTATLRIPRSLIPGIIAGDPPAFRTKREALPGFVSDALTSIYEKSGLRKGCPDLVIWDQASQRLRLVEV